jgi:hypothetical protein
VAADLLPRVSGLPAVVADDSPHISKRRPWSRTIRRKFQNEGGGGFPAASFGMPAATAALTNRASFIKAAVTDLTNQMLFVKAENASLINRGENRLSAASSFIFRGSFAIAADADLTFIDLYGLSSITDSLNYSCLIKYLFS